MKNLIVQSRNGNFNWYIFWVKSIKTIRVIGEIQIMF